MTATKAERYAAAYAERARAWGLEASVEVKHEEPTLYSSGEIMLPGRTLVWVTMRETFALGDYLHAGWVTYDQAPGHRASTRFMGARLHRMFASTKRRRDRKFRSERDFANWLAVYRPATAAEIARYEGEAQS